MEQKIVKILVDELFIQCDFDREMDEQEFIDSIASPIAKKITGLERHA